MNMEPTLGQPRIEADGFLLRPLRGSDAGLIAMYAGDARVARMTRTIPHPFPPGAAEALIARALSPERSEDLWAMDGSKQGGTEVMGLIGLEKLDRGQSQVAFWVAPAFWNTGVASAALAAIIAANPHDSQTLFAEIFQDNPASARVLTNGGFAYLGDAESYSVARAATVPTWTYTRKLS
ncbi:GNAT family N-acetyltransferase [Lutimaribacter sp. EGI FJ00015]|uniref:GNAT family N-acetyltransferase n=1 Tax=Lutimaribacter degradans TaxID=2945989 RepID=A0ACC5ZWM3_9RHOB|nr:GNAT family N-acetyltransferase [Lutimaribacter sp. EGI FJ00013]MCM2562250.1 GNAT family N-acetyltransferase [Lutimaribacter sp. EGI FJ00013]MCO0613405.1 GNAT family N-acetyltransferase [Lutimaribacter sp. EGI FJ00015]MCO0636379.1 GNAT family N-acetyltransferase [Lutimaribacter sp. EGI FJ00014]